MPILENLDLVRVTGRYVQLDGRPAAGTVTFTPSTILVDPATKEIVKPVGFVATLDDDGRIVGPDDEVGVLLPATDDPDLDPQGWSYAVQERITGVLRTRSYNMQLPHDTPTFDLSAIQPGAPPLVGEVNYASVTYVEQAIAATGRVGGGGIRCDGWAPTTNIHTRDTANIAVAVEFTWTGDGFTNLFGAWGSNTPSRAWAMAVTSAGGLRYQRNTSSGAYFAAGVTLPGPGSYVARATETGSETVLVVDRVGQTTSPNNRNEGADAGPIQIAPDGGGSGANAVVHRAALWADSGDTLLAAVDLRQKWTGQTMTDIADTTWTLTGPAPNWVMAPRF